MIGPWVVSKGVSVDRNLALEFVRITEAAAIASARWLGRGKSDEADQAAVDAMRKAFDSVNVDGTVVIGEGERDEAPMLYIGEKVGAKLVGAPQIDIALDPLEGTSICANGGVGAISVIAVAEKGKFLHAPDTYMDKVAVGPKGVGAVGIDKTPTENIKAVAEKLGKSVDEVTVIILDRPRHEDLIREVRELGSRIRLISDGDVSAAIATADDDSGIDLMLGIGGAPEGVIAAAAMKCVGGDFQGKLKFRNDGERERAIKMGVTNPEKSFMLGDLASGPVMFVATGVTDGPFLEGVRFMSGHRAKTYSTVMRSKSGTTRQVEAHHKLDIKPL